MSIRKASRGFEFFGWHIGDADGLLALMLGHPRILCSLRLGQKEGALLLLYGVIGPPIELL